jgi:nucleotide-binding universal stress UspA family protein
MSDRVRTILVAYDFSEPARRALDWARYLRGQLHAAVIVVHVDDDALSQGALRGAGSWEPAAEQDRRTRWLEDELRREVHDHFGPDAQAVRTVVTRGRVGERLHAVARELGASLVVLGTSGKNAVDRALLGSATQELVRTSSLPVMTVH